VVDRYTTVPDFIAGILELPVDIMFLAISLTVGLAIAEADGKNEFVLLLLIFIVLAILVVLFWRRSIGAFESSKPKNCIFFSAVSYIISSGCLYFSVSFLGAS
jgi:hypothetical protein